METERDKIVSEYFAAVGNYKDAVRRLTGLSGPDFETAQRVAEQYRELCERHRAQLDDYDRKGLV
jgi:hypothetical protein